MHTSADMLKTAGSLSMFQSARPPRIAAEKGMRVRPTRGVAPPEGMKTLWQNQYLSSDDRLPAAFNDGDDRLPLKRLHFQRLRAIRFRKPSAGY